MMYIGANSTTGTYSVRICSSSSDTEGEIASQEITLTSSSSNTYFSDKEWVISSDYYDNFRNGSVFIRMRRTGASSNACKIYYGGTLNNTSKGMFTCTITYYSPSVSAPGTPVVVQSSIDGTYTVSWTPSTISGPEKTIRYEIVEACDNPLKEETVATTTSTTAVIPISIYNETVQVSITAYYGDTGIYSWSEETPVVFYLPSVSAPTIDVSSSTSEGECLELAWAAATLQWTKADINYSIYIDDTYYTAAANTTQITIPESAFENLEADSHTIKLTAYAYNLTHTGDQVPTSLGPIDSTNMLTFTYDGKKTVGYYNGTEWQPCVVNYYNGSKWVECIPYYYDGMNWQEIKTK